LFRHRHVQNWQRQEGKKGPSVCRALFGWNKAPDDENDEGDDSTDDDSSNDANNVTPFFPLVIVLYCIVLNVSWTYICAITNLAYDNVNNIECYSLAVM
jgi:hypothetical protein